MRRNVFEAVVGYEDIKLELSRILDQVVSPEKYAALGVEQPHGVLLHGAPGVGKSTIAKCFMDACGRRTFVCRKDKPDGEFVNEIVRVFDQAAEAAPSVILLDDMDKFANEDENRRDAEEFVTVQACIDRVKDKPVLVIATVNNFRKLPESLTRAGRFDHVLRISRPEGKDAQAVVAHYLARKPYVANMDMKRIGRLLEGRSCAELEGVVNQAGAYAAFDGRDRVEMKDMIKAILRIVFDAPEKSNASEKSLPLIACHEAAHALIAELLEPDSVDLVTILSHDSDAAGVTSLYRDENYFHSKRLMEIRVMCLLAGKAATELCFGAVDTGTISDLRRAFAIVQRFVDDYCSFGFDKFVFTETVSNDLLSRRDTQVASEMDRYYAQVRQILVENRGKLDMLTARLLDKKILLGDEVQEILHGRAQKMAA
jgi:cell division protease FtsH